MLRRRMPLEELAVLAARVVLLPQRSVAFREAVEEIVRRDGRLAPERGIFAAGRGILAAVVHPVRHRQPVRGDDRDRRQQKRGQGHCPAPSAFCAASVAREKFQIPAALQASISFTSGSYLTLLSARMITAWPG